MGHKATYISILSLFLINQLKAQTGEGCFLKTCDQPGQVRIDAVINAAGEFVRGCHCGCDPALSDANSPKYCAPPNEINFNENTLLGDCSCKCGPGSPDPNSCIRPTRWNPDTCSCGCPSSAPDPTSCVAPQEFRPASCLCGCEQGDIGGPCIVGGAPVAFSRVTPECTCDVSMVTCPGNQKPNPTTGVCECPASVNGAFLPQCTLPTVRDPITCDCVTTTTTIPPAGPIEVECADVGDCSCPFGTSGSCTITCDGTTDACKDGIIDCNNPGGDCIVNCMSGSACAGSTTINGPAGGTLTVNCIGGQACEGAVSFNGQEGTDLTVVCEGSQACKGNVNFNFGNGKGSIACNGAPDACQGVTGFNLPVDAQITPGVAFSCTGAFCPPEAPAPFSNIVPGPAPSGPAPAPGGNAPGGGTAPAPAAPAPGTPAQPAPGSGTPAQPQTPQQAAPGQPGGGAPVAPGPGGGGLTIVNNAPPIPIVQANEIVICEGIRAECTCSGNRACTIKCESIDACKESILGCPDGFDCTVVCMDNTCLATTINAGIGSGLTVECNGMSSCTDSTINSVEAGDVTFLCLGKDSCKATPLNCGNGACSVTCDGEASCDSSPININGATSFICDGMYALDCPPNMTPQPTLPPAPRPTNPIIPCSGLPPCPCTHLQCFEERIAPDCACECPDSIILKAHNNEPNMCGVENPGQIYDNRACGCDCPIGSEPIGGCPGTQTFNQNTCQCECTNGIAQCPGASVMNPRTCECECPSSTPTDADCWALDKVLRDCECQCRFPCNGPVQIQSPETCACGCPFGTPQARDCPSGVVDEFACACAAPLPSTFCCQTSQPGFEPWYGRCWGHKNEADCVGEPNNRCVWMPTDCHPNPPVNRFGNVCYMRNEVCSGDEQCCSGTCRTGGVCR